jgi:hypothetical protein
VASLTTLIDRVRLELGDLGKTFVSQFVADGSTNRFKLDYAPLDAEATLIFKNGVDISSHCEIEEQTGVLIIDTVPADGDEMTVSGKYYRYFTPTELGTIVTDSVNQHSAGHQDSMGRKVTVESLPQIEEYPVAIYAVTIALYTLATDASFDIDIAAPDGVSIPRSERYRQLMDMVQARQAQYRDLCVQLGIGLYKVDVTSLRRISKATGRYVPVYKPQEVDDRSYPQRVHSPMPSYADKPAAWPTSGGELTAYQGRAFSTTVQFTGSYDNSISYVAKLLNQRGSVLVVQNFTLSVVGPTNGTYTATLSLTSDQTLRLAERTYWSLQIIDPNNTNPNSGSILPVEIKGDNFFTVRVSDVVL